MLCAAVGNKEALRHHSKNIINYLPLKVRPRIKNEGRFARDQRFITRHLASLYRQARAAVFLFTDSPSRLFYLHVNNGRLV
jgi:hypothetical protein